MRHPIPSLLLAAGVLAACASARPGAADPSPYGGPPPGAAAVRFAPDAIPAGRAFSAAFTPDGRSVVFTYRDRASGVVELWTARHDGTRWTGAGPAPFARGWTSADPFITRDGRRLYFSWEKPSPTAPADTVADFDTWTSERRDDGTWGEPTHVGDAPHSPQSDMYPSVTRDGTLYFDSVRPGLPARRNVWRARLAGGRYGPAEPLPRAVNDSAGGASNPYVDPDERYIIFMAGRPGGLGRGDLWISYRRPDGAWGAPQNLGPRVNTADVEFCPTVSPDGRWLLFSRIRYEGDRQVADDVYIVGIDVLPPPAP
ncbi:hypothetical protein [Roseisolibacter sp. H3M3-2]|uniref:hypothetical protein n=1 Tax=Roseisolibacter sp. H3M3-2 TaxID=3031323 RepID=UPI0023DABA35|nr:hypothetical protein [Roseisolibacter sp. H3M3-2]MDF1503180.1 hypothetical protein [Roseisolibacter sp. H3M3-2]